MISQMVMTSSTRCKAWARKEKWGGYFHNFRGHNNIMDRAKRQHEGKEKIFGNHAFNKGLIFRIYKDFSKLTLQLKWTKKLKFFSNYRQLIAYKFAQHHTSLEDTDQCCNETSLHTHYGCYFSIHLVLFFGSLCIRNFNPSHSLLPCLTPILSHTETLLLSNKTLVYVEVLGTAYNPRV